MTNAGSNLLWHWPKDGPGGPVPGYTVPDLLAYCASHHGDAHALRHRHGWVSWAQLKRQVDAVAGALLAEGLKPGDRVLHALPNSSELVVLAHACLRLGLPMVSAGPLRPADDLAEICKLTEPKLAFLLDWNAARHGQAEILGRACRRIITVSMAPHLVGLDHTRYVAHVLYERLTIGWRALPTLRFAAWAKHAPLPAATPWPKPDEIALLLPTPGIDGPTKVVILSHGNIAANTAQIAAGTQIQAGTQRFVAILPMDHAYGLFFGLALPARYAASVWPVTPLHTSRIQALEGAIRAAKPTVLPIVPALLTGLLDHLEHHPDPDTLAALRDCHVFSGAAPLLPSEMQRWERLTGVKVVEGYGCSEASPITHANGHLAPLPGHIGPPIAGTLQRLADLDNPMKDADEGVEGELWVRGPQIFQGYLDNEAATQAALAAGPDGETWLRTGDFGIMGEGGAIRLTRPRPQMINHGGFKVWPERVRQVCLRFPGVTSVHIDAKPHRVHTQEMNATIAWPAPLSPRERKNLDLRLRAYLKEHLAAYEVPRRIHIQNSTGSDTPKPTTP